MTRMGRPESWVALLAVALNVAPVDRALAQDAGVALGAGGIGSFLPPPRVVSPGAAIPANGGILIESSFGVSELRTIVLNPLGLLVTGTTIQVSVSRFAYYVWTPDRELDLGSHQVGLRDELDNPLGNAFTVEVVAATERTKPEIALSPSISAFTAATASVCCTSLNDEPVEHCALSEQHTFALVDPGLSSTETVSELNQFLFRVRAAKGTLRAETEEVFLPLGTSAALPFESADDEYCFEVDALDIVTLAEHRYPDLDHCVAASGVRVATMPVEVGDAFLADERCVLPPVGYEERWCEINANACAGDEPTSRCSLFRYACKDGPAPDEQGSSADVVRIPDGSSSGECNVSAPGARRYGRTLIPLVLFALLFRRGRSAAARAD